MLRKMLTGGGTVLIALVLAASLFAFAGCKKEVSIKGKTVLIGGFSNPYDVETYEPRSEDEEMILEARKKFLKDNNLIMRDDQFGEYNTYFQEMVNKIISGDKNYGIYKMEAANAIKLYKQGLLFPISDSSVTLPERDYNKMIEKLFTFNGKVYASTQGKTADYWQDNLIFYNKRMFGEIGEDPDILYDMQKAGTWTWDAFHNFLRRLTIDFNNNGVTDQYGIAYDGSAGFISALVCSNGADFVTLDSNGVFHDGTNAPAFLEAVNFYMTLVSEGVIKVPDAVLESHNPGLAAWDFHMSEFVDGRVAMIIAPEWAKTMFGEMVDEWGMVFPPKGPRAAGYRIGSSCTVFTVPNVFTKPEVDVILTAFKGWTTDLDTGKPYDPDGWKDGHWWAVRDTRSVNETGVMQRIDSNVVYQVSLLIPGYGDVSSQFATLMIFAEGTPAQYIEEYAPRFQALIDDANR
ncbi:MAG: extracellular solute-binding protein [Treponema sp.]|jgi:maltose-binding protein MalE|nr:extracellular solute-binding protein [Treponema sp.]